MFLVIVIAQFTAKTTNSEKAISFLSLIFCSTNNLKSRMLLTCKDFCKVFRLYMENKTFAPVNGRVAGVPPAPTPFSTALLRSSLLKIYVYFVIKFDSVQFFAISE